MALKYRAQTNRGADGEKLWLNIIQLQVIIWDEPFDFCGEAWGKMKKFRFYFDKY